ncbi:OmpA family protein [Pareuzebyella sediminis]|uniref:OmpA family protein n=1 Tax=Pareuzebyella sediminis TaxID=2607998 RepID=UPI0011EF59D4|nr:OmpA family protein [Pareuzebyella sediminis]
MLFLFQGLGIVVSQNLVRNPSFEYYKDCPKRLGNFTADVISWSTPTEGTTDYFNSCSVVMGAPENFNGNQQAEFGKGYCGLYVYAPDDYREYLQAELTDTLKKGKEYRVSFYVSLAERSDFAVNEFGLLFAQDSLKISTTKSLSKGLLYQKKGNIYTALEINYPKFFSDTKNWTLVTTQFIAKGTEKYLVLGNFKNNDRTRLLKTKRNAERGAYYYIDMVAVTGIENRLSQEQSIEETDFTINEPFIFKNVLFDFDEFRLHEPAKKELEGIRAYLIDHPELFITINGHCDATGDQSYNQKLSELRAKAVAQYLMLIGVSGQQITWAGAGGNHPIAPNTTREGRRKNRRVEFVIARR